VRGGALVDILVCHPAAGYIDYDEEEGFPGFHKIHF
jgi:hypothetical protein